MTRGTRGSGMRDRSNETPYVNPNPSNNRRGGGAKNNRNPITWNQVSGAVQRYGGGFVDAATGNLTDLDGRGGKVQGGARYITGAIDAVTGNRWDLDKHGTNEEIAAREAGKKDPVYKHQAFNRKAGTKGSKNRGKSLRYPYEALTDDTDYLQIDIREYLSVEQRSGAIFSGGSKRQNLPFNSVAGLTKRHLTKSRLKRGEGTILLPIPANIADSNSVTFADGSLDGITGQIFGSVQSAMDVEGKDLGEIGANLIENAKQSGRTLAQGDFGKALTASLAAQAANIPMGGSLTRDQVFARTSGEILNPNMELLFNGVKLRTFKFSFKLTPRDRTEAEQIKLIVRAFKENMSPKLTGGENTFLKTPNIFELTYKKGTQSHPFLNKFKQCALTDMSVNYTGEGTYATYTGGDPVSMVLELGFKELEPIYDVDYDSWEGSEGVGY